MTMIFELTNAPTPECHASTIAETSSGLVAAWFGGKHERNSDVGIWISRDDGTVWSAPLEVANGVRSPAKRYPCWNPVLFNPRNGPLMLFYKVGPSPSSWKGMLMTSDNDGATWSEPRKLGWNDRIGHILGPVKNKPIQLEDGAIICPSSTETNNLWCVHFEVTWDLGETWEIIGPINDGKVFSAIQPSILTYSDGRMQILCRSRQQVVVQSWSEDGRNWSELAPTDLPNPDSGTDAVTLSDGTQVLIYNNTTKGRSPLNIAVSSDGLNWRDQIVLEDQPGEYSYPAIIQSSDCNIHATYTYQRKVIKHVVLDPSRLCASPHIS